MNNKIISSLSIEDFAAYLDGNLSPEAMQDIVGQSDFQELLEANSAIDQSYASIIESGFEVTDEINSSDFQIPSIDSPIDFEDPTSLQMALDNLHTSHNNILNSENNLEGFNNGEEVTQNTISIGEDAILHEPQINIETQVDYTESQTSDFTDSLLS